jgi:hypothetical protein
MVNLERRYRREKLLDIYGNDARGSKVKIGIVTNAFAGDATQKMFGEKKRLKQSLVNSSLNLFQHSRRVVDEAFLFGDCLPGKWSDLGLLIERPVMDGIMVGQIS